MTAPEGLSNLDATLVLGGAVCAALFGHWLGWRLVGHGRRLAVRAYAAGRGLARPTRPLRARLARRFPRLWSWLQRRVEPRRFDGLALTLLVAAAVYLALLFAGLVEEVLESYEIDAADDAIAAFVASYRNPYLITVFTWITELGDMATLTAAAIVATGFLWARGPAAGIHAVWVTVAGSQVTTWTGKFLIDRGRPDFELDVVAWSPSFPSGHATGAMAVYGIIAYVIARGLPTGHRRFAVIYWVAILIAAIGFSRIYLSVHHASDVAAGFLVGGFWVLAGIAVLEYSRLALNSRD